MIHLALFRALAISAIFEAFAYAAISSCPRQESTYITTGRALYTVCPGSDYQGTTVELIRNVGDVTECVSLCSERSACTKAVYEPGARICHIKASSGSMTWVDSSKFDAIRLESPSAPGNPPSLPEGTQVDYCPVTENWYISGNGKTYAICAGHDFQIDDTRYVSGVGSAEACANICSTTGGCTKAVFEKANSRCHLKAPSTAKTIWTVQKLYDAIREV